MNFYGVIKKIRRLTNTAVNYGLFRYYLVAFLIRFWLLKSEYNNSISERIELSTPLNSWKRVKEGVVLYSENLNPYSGDLFHNTPIDLVFFTLLIQNCSPILIDLLFIAGDLLTSYLLHKTAQSYIKHCISNENTNRSKYVESVKNYLLVKDDIHFSSIFVLLAYLFNPYTILNCAARTTTVFSNLLLSAVLLNTIKGKILISSGILALCTLQSFYPWVLIVPICIYSCRKNKPKFSQIALPIIYFTTSYITLFAICYKISGDCSFFESTWIFILNVSDLKPNIGLFWYFFTEMFEHFRLLFLWSFQINATVLYLIPLSIRFKDDPMLLMFALVSLTTIFKSYPSIGDVSFYLALIPMWRHLFHFMQQGFVVLCFFVGCSVFAPTVWHLWIYSGSANANFYFGVTLTFATTQIFLITDVMFAYIKREFTLLHGKPNSDMRLMLK